MSSNNVKKTLQGKRLTANDYDTIITANTDCYDRVAFTL